MRVRDGLALATGVVAGAAAALVLTAGGTDASPAGPEATAPETTTTRPVWASPTELRIGPAVVVPTSLEVDGGEAVLGYEVRTVAPAPDDMAEFLRDRPPAAPSRWTLIGPGFEAVEEVVAPSNHAVRFDVPPGFEPDADTTIRLDEYYLAAPVSFEFDVDRTSAAWYDIGPGLQARVLQTLEQAENSIVIVEVEGPQALTDWMTIDGVGREWVSSSVSMLGSHRWTLDFRGDELPDPLPLIARGVQWFRIATGQSVDVEPILP
jgi:hypothetical protein